VVAMVGDGFGLGLILHDPLGALETAGGEINQFHPHVRQT
jgi:hypothetical protein